MKPSVLKALEVIAPQHVPALKQLFQSEAADENVQVAADQTLQYDLLNSKLQHSDKPDAEDQTLDDYAHSITSYIASRGTDDLLIEFDKPYFASAQPKVRQIVGSALVAEMRNRNQPVPDIWYDAQV